MAARQILIPIDDYNVDIRRTLGRGTFGIVYKGHQSSSKQTVAAKHVVYQVEGKEADEYLVNMGKNELEIFIKLKGHVNIVQLLHHHDDGESHWFIMEYCDRGDLPQYMKRENPDLLTKLNMMSACGSAVAFMHSFKPPIVHRDIKPSNVLIKREGNQDVVKVTDFGMGKLFEGTRGLVHNTMSSMVGTSSYMAPEFFGSGNALRYQPGIDVFSLGLLFMLMLDYDVTRNNWIPLSVTIAKSQKILYFGQEMSLAVSNNDPLPQLFECLSDDPVISQIQQIITDMIKYDEPERIKPVEVKCRLLDILNTMLWNKFQEQQQSQTVKQSPTDVTGVSEIKDHGETTDELQIQLDSAKLEIKEMELETNDMKRTITSVREQLQQTEEQLEKSNCKNKYLESEKMQLTQVHKLETNDMKRTITSVREQLQQTEEQLEQSNCKNRDLESDKMQMTQVHELETNDMKRTITSVREQLQQTEEQLEQSNCKNRDLESDKMQMTQVHELETNDMKRTITSVREQLQQTEEQLEKSNCKNRDLESDKMQMTQVHELETNDMKRTITSVREQLQQTEEQLEQSNCKNRDLESDKMQMTQVHELETNDMKRTITSVREQLQQTEEQLEKSNCKNRDLESDKMQMTQVHELETNDMKRTITSVREQLQQTEEQLGKSNCKNRDLESEKMQMTQVYQVEMIDLKTNVRDLQQHLEKRNTELQYVTMEMSKSKAAYQEEITGLKRENETKLGDLIQHFEDRNSENVVHQSKLESSQINVQTHTPSLPMSEVKHSDDIGIRYSGPSQFFDFEKPVAKSTVDDSGMCYASTGKYIECPICKIDFVPSATEEGISKHIEQHLVATKVCPMCNKRFSSDTDQKVFESHVQKHFYEEDPFDV